MPVTLGVLVRPTQSSGGHPTDWPLGRAALALEATGVKVIFGCEGRQGVLSGQRATSEGWTTASARVDALYDRYPSLTHPGPWRQLLSSLPGVPRANPASLIALCQDKAASQRRFEDKGLPTPPIETDPACFQERLSEWGTAFLKPRFGSFGEGIERVSHLAHPPDPQTLLQRAVLPPNGWAGWSVRVNVQRTPDNRWIANPGALRRSPDDPVVNAARGAEVVAAIDHIPDQVNALSTLARRAARAIADHPDGAWLIELGVDFAIDRTHQPWILEVNGRPQGRVAALLTSDPSRWRSAHLHASVRPLQTLAALAVRLS